MPEKHPECAGESVGPFPGITENREVRHADVHGHITEPSEKHHMPEGEFRLAFNRDPGPDLFIGHTPEIPEGC